MGPSIDNGTRRNIPVHKKSKRRKPFCLKKDSSLKIRRMTSPLLVVVFTLAAFVTTSTSGKDAVKNANVDLAEELRKSRQESAKLRQDLEKSRAETKEIIARENAQLRADADKLKRDADKLRGEDDKIKKEAEILRKANRKLRRQDEELKRKVHELHKADSEIKSSLRQRDENNTMELQNIVRNSFGFRQMDFSSELKKTINEQIQEYLDDNRICVGGEHRQGLDSSKWIQRKPKIEFGQTFQRIPTFAAALSAFDCRSDVHQSYIYVYDFHVTNSSAVFTIEGNYCYRAYVNWMACL